MEIFAKAKMWYPEKQTNAVLPATLNNAHGHYLSVRVKTNIKFGRSNVMKRTFLAI